MILCPWVVVVISFVGCLFDLISQGWFDLSFRVIFFCCLG